MYKCVNVMIMITGSEPLQKRLISRIIVFINPRIASLQKHKHIFGGNGCYNEVIDNRDGGKECKGSDKIPKSYKSFLNCQKNNSFTPKKDWLSIPWTCSSHK